MAAIAFTTPTCVRAWIEYPFQDRGDFTTKIYHHIMQVERDSYAPLAWNDVMTTADEKPTRSPFADDSAAYYVGDTEPQNTDPRMVEFDRMFANIPQTKTESNGIYSFTFPGSNVSTTTNVVTSSGNESVTFNSPNQATIVGDFVGGNLKVNSRFEVQNNIATNGSFEAALDFSAGDWIEYDVNDAFISDKSGNTVTLKVVLDSSSYEGFRSPLAISDFTLVRKGYARAPLVSNSKSIVIYSYIKADEIESVPTGKKFEVVAAANFQPTSTLDTTTIPSAGEYAELREIGGYINAESSKVRRWMGNIWEVEQILVEAL